jgi:histidyl-tRNA synthetase
MRDFLPEDVRRREYVIGVIKRVYERYGFEPLETPAVENLETLLGKYGDEGNQLIFKILKRGEHEKTGEADLALRYDLTVPLARVVAQHQAKLPRLFKRYQIQPVWRADRPARGRFREFFQCDVDSLGSTSPAIEAELCAAVADAMGELGFSDFRIRFNHRHLLTAVLGRAGFPADREAETLVVLDKLDKIGEEGVVKEWAAKGLGEEAGLADAARTLRSGLATLDGAARFIEGDATGQAAVENLRRVIELSRGTSAGPRLTFDGTLARGLSYYTGAIMEVNVAELAGSLGGGGRYDNLVGMFSGQNIPACGFSLGLERILVVMTERGMFPPEIQTSGPDVLVTIFDDDLTSESLRLATELRAASLRVELYPESLRGGKNLGKAFKYADARQARFVVVMGRDEFERGDVKIKNMKTGEQTSVPRTSAAQSIH